MHPPYTVCPSSTQREKWRPNPVIRPLTQTPRQYACVYWWCREYFGKHWKCRRQGGLYSLKVSSLPKLSERKKRRTDRERKPGKIPQSSHSHSLIFSCKFHTLMKSSFFCSYSNFISINLYLCLCYTFNKRIKSSLPIFPGYTNHIFFILRQTVSATPRRFCTQGVYM